MSEPYNYEDLQIDTGVPLPTGGSRQGSGLAHLFKRMAYGQSVFVPFRPGAKPTSLSSNCHTASRSAGVKLTIRKWHQCQACGLPLKDFIENNNLDIPYCTCKPKLAKPTEGVRVWRVDGAPNGAPSKNKTPPSGRSAAQGRKGPRV
jgi:hypothetical protein